MVLTNLMQQYIIEQATILRTILDNRQILIGDFIERFQNIEFDRIVLVGSGSSFNAGLMAKPTIESSLAVEVTNIVPTRIDDLKHMSAKHPLYVAISQGGRSTNTNKIISKLHKDRNSVIAITESTNSPITKIVDLTIYLPIGEENIGAKTKGVTATTLLLILAFLELGLVQGKVEKDFYDEAIRDAYIIMGHMEENINRALSWSQVIIPTIGPMNTFNIIAKGYDFGTAMEGRLKLLETIYKPVSCFEFEEYLHGPENAINDRTCGLLLLSDDLDSERMRQLGNFANSNGAHYFVINRHENAIQNDELSLITAGNTYLSCFEYLPALQTLCAQLSSYYCIDLTRMKYPNFYKLMDTKLI